MQIGRDAGRESDWSSDVCSSDLGSLPIGSHGQPGSGESAEMAQRPGTNYRLPGDQTGHRCRSEETREGKVTGVQTCALPIWGPSPLVLTANQARERALRWPKDLGQTIDYLETRPDIDAQRLGFYGVSSGATYGVTLIALEHRFKAAAFSSGGLWLGLPQETDPWNYAPRVRIPVLMVNGRDDFVLPVETSQMPLFNALGTPAADKRYTQYAGGHANLVSRPDLIGEIR